MDLEHWRELEKGHFLKESRSAKVCGWEIAGSGRHTGKKTQEDSVGGPACAM